MKSLRKLLEHLGLILMPANRKNRAFAAGLQSNYLGYILERELPDARGLRFLQIGANDGKHMDPLAPLLEFYGWHGVCVEPMPQPYALLEARHRENPHIITANLAISDEPGFLTLYSLVPGDGLDEKHYSALSSHSPEVLERFCQDHNVEFKYHEIKVPAITLNQLIEDHGLQNVDVLQIDAEGYDYRILKQVDFTRFHPRIINVEHAHMSWEEMREVMEMLVKADYKFLVGTSDLTAWRFQEDSLRPQFYRELHHRSSPRL